MKLGLEEKIYIDPERTKNKHVNMYRHIYGKQQAYCAFAISCFAVRSTSPPVARRLTFDQELDPREESQKILTPGSRTEDGLASRLGLEEASGSRSPSAVTCTPAATKPGMKRKAEGAGSELPSTPPKPKRIPQDLEPKPVAANQDAPTAPTTDAGTLPNPHEQLKPTTEEAIEASGGQLRRLQSRFLAPFRLPSSIRLTRPPKSPKQGRTAAS